MLKQIHIKNYALIDDVKLIVGERFNIITGETGAGKSILLGALGLLVGNRADISSVRAGEKKCIIEGEFDISNYQIMSFFEKNDLDFEELTIIRREVLVNGKSRAFINDSPVTLNVLKALGSVLIDIHSQHETQLLKSNAFYFELLDSYAGQTQEVLSFQEQYKELQKMHQNLRLKLEEQEKEKLNKDFNEFQLKELQAANLKEGEQEELEKEFEILNNVEAVKEQGAIVVNSILYDSENVNNQLITIEDALVKLASYSDSYSELAERVKSACIELKDIAEDVQGQIAGLDADSNRVEELNERLTLFFALQKKHNVVSNEQLIEKRDRLEQLVKVANGDNVEVAALEQEIKVLETHLLKMATGLSEKRKEASKHIAKEVCSDISLMGIFEPQLEFKFSAAQLSSVGVDNIEVLFSANKGTKLSPISKSASGGELSRVMLSFKKILSSKKSLPTIIFDEIDTGVSGEVASQMGSVMQKMGRTMQVISITHLPQIAGKGDDHFKVFKKHNADQTTSQIIRLKENDRVNEIAQMLSGEKLTEASLLNAKELLQ